MTTGKTASPTFTAPGLHWMENGQSALYGPLLDLFQRLDQLFLSWAADWQAEEYRFPTFISAKELHKLDYFRNFPHLLAFPVCLEQQEDNLEAFREGEPVDEHGCVQLTETCPIKDVLTPAACYHIYIALQGQKFDKTKFVTTINTCFRRELEYHPLQRQWAFSMREIVCLGTAQEVQEYLRTFQSKLEKFFKEIKLPVTFENATDPFFKPSQSPKALMQKLDPVKTELIFDQKLAIGSLNFHRSYFGETFHLDNNGPLSSGCVAFGLERWIYAFLTTYGQDASKFPV